MSEAKLEFVLCEDTVFENQCEYRFIPVEALREEIKIRLNHL